MRLLICFKCIKSFLSQNSRKQTQQPTIVHLQQQKSQKMFSHSFVQLPSFPLQTITAIRAKGDQIKRQNQSKIILIFVNQRQRRTKTNLIFVYIFFKQLSCGINTKSPREQAVNFKYKQKQHKQIIIIFYISMKLEESFDYSLNIEKELALNHQNLLALFEKKFEKSIQAQQNLLLNNLFDADFKKVCLEYIESPEMRISMKNKIQKNKFISPFLNLHQKSKPCLDGMLTEMREKLKKKSDNSNQPLTFYNQYVELSDKIQSCFIVKKGIKDQGMPEDENLALVHGKCGLKKMKKHIVHYQFTFKCSFCRRGLKNQAGLTSHQNTCKMTQKVKLPVQKRRQICHRKSKRTFKTLDEEKIHK